MMRPGVREVVTRTIVRLGVMRQPGTKKYGVHLVGELVVVI